MSNIATSPLLEAIKPALMEIVKEAVVAVLSQMDERQQPLPLRVNVDKAAELTGYSRNSLYQYHSKGLIPGAHKVGGKLMFDTKELQDWISAGGRRAS